jgi:hypothetical protein
MNFNQVKGLDNIVELDNDKNSEKSDKSDKSDKDDKTVNEDHYHLLSTKNILG